MNKDGGVVKLSDEVLSLSCFYFTDKKKPSRQMSMNK